MGKQEVLVSGKSSFKIEVPYKLINSGGEIEKPLIIYLHGFGQNIEQFQEDVSGMLGLEAYHLFIQGPYPIYDRKGSKKVDEWGRSWYLYDGDQLQFVKSMEISSEFIQELVDTLLNKLPVSRVCVIGFSMGAYLAGYFALSRWKHVTDLIMIGGRLKVELFEDREHNYEHLNVLALHGANDHRVRPKPQQESIEQLKSWDVSSAEFKILDASHDLTQIYIEESEKWLKKLGYQSH